jgi:hypothetical protein
MVILVFCPTGVLGLIERTRMLVRHKVTGTPPLTSGAGP